MTVSRPGILAIFNNVAPGREVEFEEWFQHEHLQERLGVPGFLLGRRHEALNGEPQYFNFYVTRSVEVLNSQEYRTRLNNPTTMTRLIMSEVFKDMIQRHDTDRVSPEFPGRAHARSSLRDSALRRTPDEAALKSLLQSIRPVQ